jgi:hypothetical protein
LLPKTPKPHLIQIELVIYIIKMNDLFLIATSKYKHDVYYKSKHA